MHSRHFKRIFIQPDPEQRWRYKAVRVTKYDPAFRNEQGHYMRDEWTSISDIGKSFKGELLTGKEYRSVEASYIEAVRLFMNLLNCKSALVYEVYKYADWYDFPKWGSEHLYGAYLRLQEHSTITGNEIDKVVKLALREFVYCSLLVDKATESYVHFGYDYYMYFVSNVDVSVLKADIRKLDLYLD